MRASARVDEQQSQLSCDPPAARARSGPAAKSVLSGGHRQPTLALAVLRGALPDLLAAGDVARTSAAVAVLSAGR